MMFHNNFASQKGFHKIFFSSIYSLLHGWITWKNCENILKWKNISISFHHNNNFATVFESKLLQLLLKHTQIMDLNEHEKKVGVEGRREKVVGYYLCIGFSLVLQQ